MIGILFVGDVLFSICLVSGGVLLPANALHDCLSHFPDEVRSHKGDFFLLNLSLIGLCVGSILLLDDLVNVGDCLLCVGLLLGDLYPGMILIGDCSPLPGPR